jgi:predicted transcriptional regulator
MTKSVTIAARVDADLDHELARLAEATGRSKSWLISEALRILYLAMGAGSQINVGDDMRGRVYSFGLGPVGMVALGALCLFYGAIPADARVTSITYTTSQPLRHPVIRFGWTVSRARRHRDRRTRS